LSRDFDAGCMLLAMIALTWFPIAFPQLTRLITGQLASDKRFVRKHKAFLRSLAGVFQPKKAGLAVN
jgi:hypothetical protein